MYKTMKRISFLSLLVMLFISMAFINCKGQLIKKNNRILDRNYVPLQGALSGVDNPFSVASNDNQQNNLGLVSTSNHFFNVAFDTKINASGADKFYTGLFNQLRVGGTAYSGTPSIRGIWNQVNNRQNLTATPNIYGIDSSVSVEGHATTAWGGSITVFKGSAVNALKLIGLSVQAANAYTNADEVTGLEVYSRTINPSFAPTTTLNRTIWSHFQQVNGVTTTINGLEVSGWSVTGGTVGTASGIYIDNSISVGSTNYAIQSLSTAKSQFAGSLNSSAGVSNFSSGSAVASAAAITPTGNLFHVTGTTAITSITSTGIPAGTRITIIFDGILTFTDGNNLKLNGNFSTTADDTITLVYDGTNWFEVARAAN